MLSATRAHFLRPLQEIPKQLKYHRQKNLALIFVHAHIDIAGLLFTPTPNSISQPVLSLL